MHVQIIEKFKPIIYAVYSALFKHSNKTVTSKVSNNRRFGYQWSRDHCNKFHCIILYINFISILKVTHTLWDSSLKSVRSVKMATSITCGQNYNTKVSECDHIVD